MQTTRPLSLNVKVPESRPAITDRTPTGPGLPLPTPTVLNVSLESAGAWNQKALPIDGRTRVSEW